MELLIITGLSGAGKSRTIATLEDIGYFCVDNVPVSLVEQFSALCLNTGDISKLAIVTDGRSGNVPKYLMPILNNMEQKHIIYRILFLDCSDQTLFTRYKATRRRHPLQEESDESLDKAVLKERNLMAPIRELADIVIDTSLLSPAQLRNRLLDLFLLAGQPRLIINCLSFGFKYGLPLDADLVFDVRCLPNPFYIPQLKAKTGLDTEVQEYVLQFSQSKDYLEKLKDLLSFTLPLYEQEGKNQLMVAFGCTGGKHRSITFAEQMNTFLKTRGYTSYTVHRDFQKE